ncbi:MAG: 23S rRNA (adenine(2503)-C(2))-methyltransferase RlmN [Desulfobacterales bacterium]|nr:23S rRNA (adenine(2503)-C(2))-methyltransferase RlmN [Desulfobacterales bacterium]
MSTQKTDLKGLDTSEIESWAIDQGLEAYRGRQIHHWLLRRLASSFEEMTNLPKALRALLAEKGEINHLHRVETRVSEDGTRKYVFKLMDGHLIESVLIPEKDHFTLCISSQAGCAMGCGFCLTATQGLKRDLTASEIVEQVVQVKRSMDTPNRLTNIVFMGMGEPLANYDAVMKAVGNLISRDGMNFSHRRVTVSTCGLVPRLIKMGRDITVNLAVSLNAADDETRSLLMPINRKYPLKSLLSACRGIPLPSRRMITFEYILIKGINDSRQDALRLCRLLSDIRGKINLIRLNPFPDSDMVPCSMENAVHFQETLLENSFITTIRKSKGKDILAACGQLSGQPAGS